MNRSARKTLFAVGTASALIGGAILGAAPASAQDGGPPPPPQGQGYGQGQGGGGGRGGFGGGPGGGRGGFGGGPGGFGGMMGNQAPSAANLPLRLMASYLALTDAQVGKIALSRDDMQEASRPTPMRRGAGGQGGQQGGPGGGGGADMQAMFAEMNAKRQSAEKKAVAEIRTILSPEQTTKLATLIKAMESLRTAGYRPEAVGKLQLNDEQLTRISRGGTVESILTPDQMAIAETFRMPRGGPGGPGGPGGGPGGPGGPDGQGGPPPPPQDQQ